jgi:hypothetical protein
MTTEIIVDGFHVREADRWPRTIRYDTGLTRSVALMTVLKRHALEYGRAGVIYSTGRSVILTRLANGRVSERTYRLGTWIAVHPSSDPRT